MITDSKTGSCNYVELKGNIKSSGIVRISSDVTIRDIVYDIGGGISEGKGFKAVLLGGTSGICLSSNFLSLTLDSDSLKRIGFTGRLESIQVIDECTCMVEMVRSSMSSIIQGLCGKCIPCREGTKSMLEILERITSGGGTKEDIDNLQDLACTVADTSLCRLGKISANPVISTLKYFKDEYIAHVVQKKCPAGLCEMDATSRRTEALRVKGRAFEYCNNIA
ncbi:MAG: hypothetical protein K0R31_2371 [Clostridiales bacterium]|nr:hypothetical protein [Clostridiales bacterium]